MRVKIILIGFLVLAWQSPDPALAGDWPQFRGPRGDGTTDASNLPVTWGGLFDPVTWQSSVPGRGWSSPVVAGNRIWLTTAEPTALPESARQERLADHVYGADEFQVHADVSFLAIELDAQSGKLTRRLTLLQSESPKPIHVMNSYASPTPVIDGGYLYCHFGALGTVAVEISSGQVIWTQRLRIDDITGPGSSPVVWGDHLIISCDGADEQYLVALKKQTGEIAWKTARPLVPDAEGRERRAFSTPLVFDHAGRTQVITTCAQWAVSYDPETGREYWRARLGVGHALVPRPVRREGLVFVCTGYFKPELVAIRVDGSGDVSETHVAWRHKHQVPEISSPVLVGRELYFVSSVGIATCLDAETGAERWQHRLGGNYASSPIAGDGKIYFTSQEGVTTVLEAGPEYRELAKNRLAGQVMASLAVYDQGLLIRSDPILYFVRKR